MRLKVGADQQSAPAGHALLELSAHIHDGVEDGLELHSELCQRILDRGRGGGHDGARDDPPFLKLPKPRRQLRLDVVVLVHAPVVQVGKEDRQLEDPP